MTKPLQFDLSGRTALVTGASSGLGARFGLVLAAAGAKVVLGARRTDRLEQLKQDIVADGGEAAAIALDVTDERSVIAAYDAAEKAFGVVDTVIANAGIALDKRSTELAAEDFDQLMAVNVRGVFLTAREGARRLIASGSKDKENGRIVIVSSIAAHKVFRGGAAYGASKAAVLQMGKGLALDWARLGINVNMVLPGYIRTELTDDLFSSEFGKQLMTTFPRRRLSSGSDLDAVLLFLCSDASRGITGAEITVDDGQSLS